jgi:hypothetical protein
MPVCGPNLCECSTTLRSAHGADDGLVAVPATRKLKADWPPMERMPEHIQDALRAGERHDRGEGPPLTPEQVEALMDLTAWAFNGVPRDHPQFESRLSAWTAQVLERHGHRTAA